MTDLLRTNGFLFTGTEISAPAVAVDYGEGYRSRGAIVGEPDGLRRWTAKISVLPDTANDCKAIAGKSRASYLWDFFRASKAADDRPFYLYDHKSDQFFLASFVDDALDFDQLCAKVFSTGLNFRERRDPQITSPIAGFAILDESGSAILDETGDALIEEGIF